MKKWKLQNKKRVSIDNLIDILLSNRSINTKKDREDFLNPKLENLTIERVGIDTAQLTRALKRIKKAIEKKEQIIGFGD